MAWLILSEGVSDPSTGQLYQVHRCSFVVEKIPNRMTRQRLQKSDLAFSVVTGLTQFRHLKFTVRNFR